MNSTTLIYGAGDAAKLFFENAPYVTKNTILGFIDDDEKKRGTQIYGLPVFSFAEIFKTGAYKKMKLEAVVLALPSQTLMDKINIISQIPISLNLYSVPSIQRLASRESDFSDLIYIDKQFQKSELKSEIPLDYSDTFFDNKTILVTGAGGSIGSEVCKQLISKNIKKLVGLDSSEFNLFELDETLNEHCSVENLINLQLGSVTDRFKVAEVFSNNEIDYVIHCAAYKHVHLLEKNPSSALINNVLGTHIVAAEAERKKVKKFILISTDKAVNPTNTMGASKRLCEKIIYAYNQKNSFCTFALVRFGNVLGSSGSVIPIFEKQIQKGNHVTLTHPDVSRFFMSIREAVTLILCAQEISEGGEAFVLNMGRPKKIIGLAELIIKLMGKKPVYKKNSEDPSEIAIKIIGMRQGEKLHEELSISKKLQKTRIPDIMMDVHIPENVQDFLTEICSISDKEVGQYIKASEAKQFFEKWQK